MTTAATGDTAPSSFPRRAGMNPPGTSAFADTAWDAYSPFLAASTRVDIAFAHRPSPQALSAGT